MAAFLPQEIQWLRLWCIFQKTARAPGRSFTSPVLTVAKARGLLKLWLIVNLCERDAEPILFPPYDPAMSAHLIGHHGQHEFVGNS